ncbi:MAG: PH domain-containing protein [Rhodothermus sp.]|nr:PH domain-containing protein [Rhodothermus sp.]
MVFLFRPRIDRGLVGLLVVGLLLPLGVGVWLIVRGETAAGLILLMIGSLDLFLMRVLVWPMYYEVRPEALVVHSGMIQLRVPYARIQRITRHHPWRDFSLRAIGFSLSLREALRIEYGRTPRPNWLVIAPEDPVAFLEAIARYAPMLQQTGRYELTRQPEEDGHLTAASHQVR